MPLRVAVASSDGIVVNRHFGRADLFIIFEYTDNKFAYIEKRNVNPICHFGEHEAGDLEKTADILNDCSAVIASKVGNDAAAFLESRGFAVYEAPFKIEDVLEMLASAESGV